MQEERGHRNEEEDEEGGVVRLDRKGLLSMLTVVEKLESKLQSVKNVLSLSLQVKQHSLYRNATQHNAT